MVLAIVESPQALVPQMLLQSTLGMVVITHKSGFRSKLNLFREDLLLRCVRGVLLGCKLMMIGKWRLLIGVN